MTELQTSGDFGLPHIPDNLTIAQFMLDYQHEIRPVRGNVPCLVDDQSGNHITLETLKERTECLANALCIEYNISDKDTAMLISPNHIDYPVATWAIHRLGGVVTFSNPQFKPNEIAYQLTTAKVTFIVVHSLVLGIVLSAARLAGFPLGRVILLDQSSISNASSTINSVPELISVGRQKPRAFCERLLNQGEGKTKIALLCWSSGTTGKPKVVLAVVIPHHALIANIIQMAAHNHVNRLPGYRDNRSYRPGDVALGVLPFYHVAGLVIGLHLILFCAMTLIVVPKYDFMDMLNTISRHNVSHLILVPPQAMMFSKHPAVQQRDYSKIGYVMIGAAPVSREVQERLCEIFPSAQIGQAYGLTEMTTTLAMVSATQKKGPLGSGGRLLPGIEAQVIKPNGSLARFGERGELMVKGPAKALGYFGNLQAVIFSTDEAFVDGWVRTGDDVILTADREIFEILNVKGFQVAPAELEGCLLSHPDVADACVVGIADGYSGELPVAYVVLMPAAAQSIFRNAVLADYFSERITKYIEDRKASYKHLTGGIRFIDSIPRNGSGKTLRRLLRDDAKEQISNGNRGRVRL
ncbi:acetyl-CoA synthetase-like protein [Phlegmacium glaucopus]|nr:acetyl-CoA synthetase-like protein [Phlegmacium glaucopus]